MRISEPVRRFLPAILFAALLVSPTVGDEWLAVRPDFAWDFPRDHWAHPGFRTEWWYFTGHLEDENGGARYGYQFTVFRVGVRPRPAGFDSAWDGANLLMGHASIVDKRSGEHRFSEVLWRETPMLARFGAYPDPELAWSRGPAGTDGVWSLSLAGETFSFEMADARRGFELRLAATPSRARVFQGPNGFSRKAEDATVASHYYSYTRMATEGEVAIDGRRVPVRGSSWMDREWSSTHLGGEQVGWDWFSLNLDDGRDVMLYVLRRADGSADYAHATVVDANGSTRYLETGAWSYRPTDRWTSKRSDIVYPSGWEIEIPGEGLTLRVAPAVAAQENVAELAARLAYWEGAVEVTDRAGRPTGRGYVELTGYGDENRPPI